MKNYLKLFAVIGVLIVSCKKDKTPFPLEHAYNDLEHGWQDDFGDEDFIYPGWSFLIEDSLQFHVPQFNPSNPNEIIYYRHDYPSNSHQLVKYNLKTTEKMILTQGLIVHGEPTYGLNGHIAFSTLPGLKLYDVKDDNSVQINLIYQFSAISPTWSNNSCLYFTQIETPSIRRLLKLCSDYDFLDTIVGSLEHNNLSSKKVISKNNQILLKATIDNSGYYAFANLLEDSFVLHPIYNFIDGIAHDTEFFCWSHDSQYIYLAYHSTGKIYRVRVNDGEIELFRDQYNGNWLHSIAASPDGKYLIVERVVLSNTYTATGELNLGIRTHSQIQLIDIATKKIKILDLD